MSDQHIEPELTVAEILKVYLSHWRMYVIFTAILFCGVALFYFIKVPFVSSASIVINDSQNSSLQAFSSQFFGLSKTIQESKKGSSLLSKHIEYLKTRDFFESLVGHIDERGSSPLITLDEHSGYQFLKSEYMQDLQIPAKKTVFLQKLNEWIKAELDSDFKIKFTAATAEKNMSLFLANTASEWAVVSLKKRELAEIERVAQFMEQQKLAADANILALGKRLAELHGSDRGLFPLASKEKMGDYVSELLVRANELRIKISENKKLLDYFEKGSSGQNESTLYGIGGKIMALRLENNLLQEKLSQVQNSIGKLKSQAKELPIAAEMIEELKRKLQFEFDRYKELANSLSKLEAQKISIDTRFEVLEQARFESTFPQVRLLNLVLLAILLAQFIGSLVIYFKYLWNPNVVTAQASRNLVIFDNSNLDPRIIFENSKIKFKFRKTKTATEPVPAVETKKDEPDKISWNVIKTNQGPEASP